jgi:cytochrome c biogenesis protein CcdA
MFVVDAVALGTGAGLGVLVTGLLLGVRHGFDWDHIAAITDITSTTATTEVGLREHALEHEVAPHAHDHGGASEASAHAAHAAREVRGAALGPAPAGATAGTLAATSLTRNVLLAEQRHAILLGTLYALGHATVVAILGLAALLFGALLPDWVDPIMGRVVGLTLLLLGLWVFVSLYQYARHGTAFRLRSRWMLVFDGGRYAWRRLAARLHGHEHVDPIEMSSYGPRTAFGVGMIHGIGAETGTQVLIIAAVGGAAGQGLGVPMMVAFIAGLLISNTIIVVISATGFVASQIRDRLYLAIGVVAGTFSIVIGVLFLFGAEDTLPDLEQVFGFLGR